ncbi:MAG: hypothetical protein A2X86_03765 [Bdellovibrionales bacterium GWA2_49_15]|nr:MAG: hypothetical protein A2X86_03765 [Bdellovibrionales bacterium GWA2_49_15]HAZ12334.1 hypothetical protein [Bdellovibrionales bacterium]
MKKDFRLIIIIAVQIILSIVVIATLKSAKTVAIDANALRHTAAKLESAGLLDEAIANYEKYLESGNLTAKEKSLVAFSLGELSERAGHFEKAVKWYYDVETYDPTSGHQGDAGKAVVALLEKLQKYSAANMVLAEKTALNPKQGGKIVAKVGGKEFYDYELNEFMDTLPPNAREEIKGPQKKSQMLQAFVADKIILEHALKMGFDKDPELRKKLQQVEKQLIVGKVYETEIQTKMKTDESDLENFYKANKEKYKKPYKEVKDMVKQEYVMAKAQNLYQELVQEKVKTEKVELFPENIK